MEELERAAKALPLPAEGAEADWLGRVTAIIRTLNEKKLTVLDELPGPVDGDEYRVVEANTAKRSYNTAAILARFAAKGYDLTDLIGMRAAQLEWRWTQLKRAAAQADVDLEIAHHEIEDFGEIEGPLVGEVWASPKKIEGKQ